MTPLQALLRGWGDLLRPRILGLLLRGIGLTLALFVALQAAIFWAIRSLTPGTVSLPFWGEVTLGPALGWGSLALFPILGFFLMAPVAASFAGLYTDRVAREVEAIHYPLAQGFEGDFWDGLLESLAVMGAVLLVGLVTLIATPLIGPLAPLLFYGANGWLLGREFFQMAARRHLPDPEATRLRQQRSLAVTALGVLIAFGLTLPFVNIAVPVLAAAAFTHLYHMLSGSADPSS